MARVRSASCLSCQLIAKNDLNGKLWDGFLLADCKTLVRRHGCKRAGLSRAFSEGNDMDGLHSGIAKAFTRCSLCDIHGLKFEGSPAAAPRNRADFVGEFYSFPTDIRRHPANSLIFGGNIRLAQRLLKMIVHV